MLLLARQDWILRISDVSQIDWHKNRKNWDGKFRIHSLIIELNSVWLGGLFLQNIINYLQIKILYREN